MKCRLTMQEKIKDLRIENGLSLEQLADSTGISKSALSSYETDENKEINSYNLCRLASFYHVSADYLLGLSEARQPAGMPAKNLPLSEEAVNILLSNKYNPLLLSEIITNKNFLRFMVDAEIYVDGNVTAQFHTLNKMLDAERMIYVKKANPSEYNLQMETLRKISIDEDAFFEHTLSEDIVRIMKEIHHSHLGDVESRADTSIVDRMVSDVDEVAGSSGTPRQKFKMIFPKWFGKKDTKIPESTEEQIDAVLSSDLMKPTAPDKRRMNR